MRRAKRALVRAGLHELRRAPFASQDDLDLFGDTDAIAVANPLRADEGFLRTRLTPGSCTRSRRNQAAGLAQVAVFEVGTTFRLAEPFTEHRKAGFALAGPADEGWSSDGRALDVLDAKGVLDGLLRDLGVRAWTLGPAPSGPFHPGRSSTVLVEGREVGVLGEVAPGVAAALELDGRVSVGVVGLGSIAAAAAADVRVPRGPPVPAGATRPRLRRPRWGGGGRRRPHDRGRRGPLLDRCALFDVFRGDPLPSGSTSLAFAVDLRAPDRTLTDADAEPVVARDRRGRGAEHGGQLRTA